MLYGAFVFDKTCIKGGCAIAIPNLFYFYLVCLISCLRGINVELVSIYPQKQNNNNNNNYRIAARPKLLLSV